MHHHDQRGLKELLLVSELLGSGEPVEGRGEAVA